MILCDIYRVEGTDVVKKRKQPCCPSGPDGIKTVWHHTIYMLRGALTGTTTPLYQYTYIISLLIEAGKRMLGRDALPVLGVQSKH